MIRTGGIPGDLPGAAAVHGLRDLAACAEPDEFPVVLIDSAGAGAGYPADQVEAVLQTLEAVASEALVVTSVRPVTDTLKRVGACGPRWPPPGRPS